METRPVKTIPIHDHLRGKLCDLYENDCIFDKFECVWGGDDRCVAFLSIDGGSRLTRIYVDMFLLALITTTSGYMIQIHWMMLCSRRTSRLSKPRRSVDHYLQMPKLDRRAGGSETRCNLILLTSTRRSCTQAGILRRILSQYVFMCIARISC